MQNNDGTMYGELCESKVAAHYVSPLSTLPFCIVVSLPSGKCLVAGSTHSWLYPGKEVGKQEGRLESPPCWSRVGE